MKKDIKIKKIRTCRLCGVTNDEYVFFGRYRKLSTGTIFRYENICIYCKRQELNKCNRRWYKNNKERRYLHNIMWRNKNRIAYNKSERERRNRNRNILTKEDYGVLNGF